MKKGKIDVIEINVLIVIMSVTCFIWAETNNERINTVAESFVYGEEKRNVRFKLKSGKEITIQFGEKSAKVYNSYTANSKEEVKEIVLFIRWYAEQKGYEVVQAYTDMCGEYRLHNLIYWLGYKREQTGDSDLDYEKDKRWYVNGISKIIGRSGF